MKKGIRIEKNKNRESNKYRLDEERKNKEWNKQGKRMKEQRWEKKLSVSLYSFLYSGKCSFRNQAILQIIHTSLVAIEIFFM